MPSSFPKTTRPPASSQRPSEAGKSSKKISRKMDAFPDKIDVRDWFYQPGLQALPDQILNMDKVPLILDQGEEGACTGFALAAVINYHLTINGRFTRTAIKKESVSPRMLYEMARRYDEWPGEKYEGSSARGTMKGWIAHGVASRKLWPDTLHGPSNLDEQKCSEARLVPAGAYYRVLHRQIRDMHSALQEAGVLYATIMVHEGWDQDNLVLIKKYKAGNKTYRLPVIERKKRADSGHAIAIVGYTLDGFIIQNSCVIPNQQP